MATYNKYNSAVEVMAENANISTDVWRVILSNTSPSASNTTQATANELTTSGGYTVNGNVCSTT